ncbi:holin [Nonomuraea phyllanthi]|uniref:holin n=1 Tax=Nonomuraea phyllanthi TaxID=2219224 RepID=UPI0012934066|nr:holin [Nonomuraea phyllanthi]QFY09656.1 holin [Nonomuraea phyllanthi]
MHADPEPTYTRPVETKVKAMTLTAYLSGVAGMAVLQTVADNPSMISFLPDWVEAIILPLVPTALAAVAGWKARHTPRPDLPDSQR